MVLLDWPQPDHLWIGGAQSFVPSPRCSSMNNARGLSRGCRGLLLQVEVPKIVVLRRELHCARGAARAITLSRSCARRVLCWLTFPSASALGSTDSAAGCPALFVGFPATIAESDFPRPFIIGYGSSPSRCGPAQRTAAGQTWDLPVPVQGASAHARFFDLAGPFGPCDGASETCCLPRSKQRRHPGIGFRGSMAGLCPPLPTLRRRPYGHQRTARGRCGSLLLHRSGLAPPTPCRSPGALRVLPHQPGSPVS